MRSKEEVVAEEDERGNHGEHDLGLLHANQHVVEESIRRDLIHLETDYVAEDMCHEQQRQYCHDYSEHKVEEKLAWFYLCIVTSYLVQLLELLLCELATRFELMLLLG